MPHLLNNIGGTECKDTCNSFRNSTTETVTRECMIPHYKSNPYQLQADGTVDGYHDFMWMPS